MAPCASFYWITNTFYLISSFLLSYYHNHQPHSNRNHISTSLTTNSQFTATQVRSSLIARSYHHHNRRHQYS